MNTVSKSVTNRELVVVTMESIGDNGRLTRREIGDFIMQSDREYERDFGHQPKSDDAYYVYGDEEGLHAEWERE